MRYQSFDTNSAQVSILKYVNQYWTDESGATAIEYGLVSALISVLLISASSAIGGNLNEKYTSIAKLISGEGPFSGSNSPPEGPTTNSAK